MGGLKEIGLDLVLKNDTTFSKALNGAERDTDKLTKALVEAVLSVDGLDKKAHDSAEGLGNLAKASSDAATEGRELADADMKAVLAVDKLADSASDGLDSMAELAKLYDKAHIMADKLGVAAFDAVSDVEWLGKAARNTAKDADKLQDESHDAADEVDKLGRDSAIAAPALAAVAHEAESAAKKADNLQDQAHDAAREIATLGRNAFGAALGVGALGLSAFQALIPLGLMSGIIAGIGLLVFAAAGWVVAAAIGAIALAGVAANLALGGLALGLGLFVNFGKESSGLEQSIKDITGELDKLKKAGKENTDEYSKLKSKLDEVQAVYDTTMKGMLIKFINFGKEASAAISLPLFTALKSGLASLLQQTSGGEMDAAITILTGKVALGVQKVTDTIKKMGIKFDFAQFLVTTLGGAIDKVFDLTNAFLLALPTIKKWLNIIGDISAALSGPILVYLSNFGKALSKVRDGTSESNKGFNDMLKAVKFLGEVMAISMSAVGGFVRGIVTGLEPTLLRLADKLGIVVDKSGGFDKVLENVGKVAFEIGQGLGVFVGWVIEFGVAVGPFIGQIWEVVKAFSPLSLALATIQGFIDGGLGGAWEAFSTQFGKGLEALGLGGLTNIDIGAGITKLIPSIMDGLGQVGQTVLGWIVEQAPLIKEQLLTWGKEFVQWLIDGIPLVWEQLTIFGGQLFQWLADQIPNIASQLKLWASSFLDWINQEVLPNLLPELQKIGHQVVQFVLDKGPDIIAQLALWALAFWDWATNDALPKLVEALGQILGAMISFSADTLLQINVKMLQWASAFVGWVGDVLRDLPGHLADILAMLLGWIGDTAKSAVGVAGDIGRNIIAGIVNGIRESPGRVWDALKGVLGGAWDLVKGFLKMGSPSKLFFEAGASMPTGVQAGAEAAAAASKAAINAALIGIIPDPGNLKPDMEWVNRQIKDAHGIVDLSAFFQIKNPVVPVAADAETKARSGIIPDPGNLKPGVKAGTGKAGTPAPANTYSGVGTALGSDIITALNIIPTELSKYLTGSGLALGQVIHSIIAGSGLVTPTRAGSSTNNNDSSTNYNNSAQNYNLAVNSNIPIATFTQGFAVLKGLA